MWIKPIPMLLNRHIIVTTNADELDQTYVNYWNRGSDKKGLCLITSHLLLISCIISECTFFSSGSKAAAV